MLNIIKIEIRAYGQHLKTFADCKIRTLVLHCLDNMLFHCLPCLFMLLFRSFINDDAVLIPIVKPFFYAHCVLILSSYFFYQDKSSEAHRQIVAVYSPKTKNLLASYHSPIKTVCRKESSGKPKSQPIAKLRCSIHCFHRGKNSPHECQITAHIKSFLAKNM